MFLSPPFGKAAESAGDDPCQLEQVFSGGMQWVIGTFLPGGANGAVLIGQILSRFEQTERVKRANLIHANAMSHLAPLLRIQYTAGSDSIDQLGILRC